MMKRSSWLTFLAVLLFAFPLFAEETSSDKELKLEGLRQKEQEITRDYKNESNKINNIGDEELVAIKKDFHKKRNESIGRTETKLQELEASYKEKIRPVLDEEKQLLESMGQTMNFAKPKALRETK